MSNSYKITVVKDVCQVSQSIARQKKKNNKKIAGVLTTAPWGKPQGKPAFKTLRVWIVHSIALNKESLPHGLVASEKTEKVHGKTLLYKLPLHLPFACQPHPESRFPLVGHGRGCSFRIPWSQVEWAASIPNMSVHYLHHHLSVQVTWGGVSINHGLHMELFGESAMLTQTWTRSTLWQMDGVDGGISKNKDVLSAGLCVWLPRHCSTLGKSHFPLLHPAAPVAGDLGPRVARRPLYPSFIPLALGTYLLTFPTPYSPSSGPPSPPVLLFTNWMLLMD